MTVVALAEAVAVVATADPVADQAVVQAVVVPAAVVDEGDEVSAVRQARPDRRQSLPRMSPS